MGRCWRVASEGEAERVGKVRGRRGAYRRFGLHRLNSGMKKPPESAVWDGAWCSSQLTGSVSA